MTRLAGLALFLLAAPVLAQEDGGQSLVEGAIVDLDFAFRLEEPKGSWRLLPEADIQRWSPDAVAGAMGVGGSVLGAFGAVIVEPSGGMTLQEFAEIILSFAPLEEMQVVERTELTYCGQSALRLVTTGNVSGIRYRFDNRVFLYSDHAYQVMLVQTQDARESDSGGAFHDAFALLEREVTGRDDDRVVGDMHGVGWEVADGTFSSAALRLELTAPEGWRLAVGDELDQMDQEAEVGLVSVGSEAYLTVHAEAVADVEEEAFAAVLLEDVLFSLGVEEPRKTLELEAGGVARSFAVIEAADLPFTFVHGSWFVGNFCYQVTAWFARGGADSLGPIARGLAAIRHLDEAEAGRVAERLRAKPDMENEVGPTFSLRAGLFQEFALGLRVRKPAHGFWRMTAGEEARLYGQEALVLVEEPSLGLFVKVEGMPIEDLTLAELHELAVQAESELMLEPTSTSIVPRRLADRDGLYSTLRDATRAYAVESLMWTVAYADRVVWVTVYALEGILDVNGAALDELFAGFELHDDPLPMTAVEEGEYVDHRLGFGIVPDGEPRRFQEMTPPEMRAVGTLVEVQGTETVVLAINAVMFEQDAEFLVRMVGPIVERYMGAPGLEPRTDLEAELAGYPAVVRSWGNDEDGADFVTAVRGRTYYCVLGTGTAEERERKLGWLRLE
jgi:hypothetical protein